jgi:hypothetical protein
VGGVTDDSAASSACSRALRSAAPVPTRDDPSSASIQHTGGRSRGHRHDGSHAARPRDAGQYECRINASVGSPQS